MIALDGAGGGGGGCDETLITSSFLITHSYRSFKQNPYCLKARQLSLVRGIVLCLMILRAIFSSIRRTFIYFQCMFCYFFLNIWSWLVFRGV